MKTINGVTLLRRPVSSSCPKGAWFGSRYHTSWVSGYWNVWETGVALRAMFSRVKEAQEFIADAEKRVTV